MKKILTAFLSLCMLLSFSACDDKDKSSSEKSTEDADFWSGDYKPVKESGDEALSGITYENYTEYLKIVNNGIVFENGLVNMTNGMEILPLEYEDVIEFENERYPLALVSENKSAVVDLKKEKIIVNIITTALILLLV